MKSKDFAVLMSVLCILAALWILFVKVPSGFGEEKADYVQALIRQGRLPDPKKELPVRKESYDEWWRRILNEMCSDTYSVWDEKFLTCVSHY